MFTVISYVLLNQYGGNYSGWLYVLPVLLDMALLDMLGRIAK